MSPELLLTQLVITACMAGLIWFVQICHYPLYGVLDPQSIPAYERVYVARAGRLIPPVMLAELALAAAWAWDPGPAPLPGLAWAGGIALAGIWLSTFLLQVPCHRRLAEIGDPDTARRLVRTNWIRTLLWTFRVLVLWYAVCHTSTP